MNNLDKYFDVHGFTKREYGERIRRIIDGIESSLLEDEEMRSYFACELNSASDLYIMFKEYVDNWLLLNLIPSECHDIGDMEMYNIMTDGEIYKAWTTDLFNRLKQ